MKDDYARVSSTDQNHSWQIEAIERAGVEKLFHREESGYLKGKFSRFLNSLGKITQHGTSKTYIFVPLQKFESVSDIDWSKSVSEIDQQLYKKYGLDKEEIAFIESRIKAMD